MLPFASMLAVAAIGQTLVIQQRGLDLTVPGMILLSTVIITEHAGPSNGRLPVAILLVVAACVASGVLSGLAITQLGITPLIATLGVNDAADGHPVPAHQRPGNGVEPARADELRGAQDARHPEPRGHGGDRRRRGGRPHQDHDPGRRFVAVGASTAAARVAGIRVTSYVIATYVFASLTYGLAGIMIAGYFPTPGPGAGSTYLLPTIAAVVLGGTSLAGGTGSVIATAVGAVFLTQLDQVLTANGASEAVEFMIQGAIIALGMLLRNVPWHRLYARIPARPTPPARVGSAIAGPATEREH